MPCRQRSCFAIAACAAMLLTLHAGSATFAQTYGQNPGTPGFVPLVSGPIPAGTTGGLEPSAQANGSFAANGFDFGLGNNVDFLFSPGRLTITATNVSDFGLLHVLGSFGTLDVTFESMTGIPIRLRSTFDGTTLIATIDFNAAFSGDASDNPNDVPDANPVDENVATDDSAANNVDNNPGNPYAN